MSTELVAPYEERLAFQQSITTSEYFWNLVPTFGVVLGAAFGFHLFRATLLRFTWPLALKLGLKKDRTISRWVESTYYSLYYIGASILGVYVLMNEEWSVFPTTNFWVGWPLQPMGMLFEVYYLGALAFYSHCLFSLLFLDVPRKDFLEYLIHHIVCIYLILNSYYVRIHRYGLIILILHDTGDAILYTTKCFRYLDWEPVTTIGFGAFAIVFFLTRLVFLPMYVIPSGYFESADLDLAIPGHFLMNVSLVALQCLHVVWFTFLVSAISRFARGHGVDDTRSDEEPIAADGDDNGATAAPADSGDEPAAGGKKSKRKKRKET